MGQEGGRGDGKIEGRVKASDDCKKAGRHEGKSTVGGRWKVVTNGGC